jgi:hypothetical protein
MSATEKELREERDAVKHLFAANAAAWRMVTAQASMHARHSA